ncbi:YbhB/YbcL family Raf kinase inhibitor-like protein [Colwellia sp. C1TZA3]|uniref:YbhB/YbcL family Raf kinase inhibitor-like protein n=1 Tax=Colwellia sp. C1TZA3 TaxID=2508879 RepID=UPI0011B96922|nr:YbhB/YbcL family Raf kinase inhibitor-like protein [Colwellia sp. C1TZA3]TWX66659.1 YbhB/YbcL family Raf kinase inhibitor-like protein [Colwellia sp. C1TZA3]
MFNILKIFSVLSLSVSVAAFSAPLTLSSQDIAQGEFMSKTHEFRGYSCSGGDLSPHLKWSDAPKGTKSFAITAYDPDTASGSGWWHWQVINIPVTVLEIPTGVANKKNSIPKGSTQIENDFSIAGFSGACPPKGDGLHHYRFTIHALSVDKIDLPENTSGALAGYMINLHTIESSTIEALYQRD